MYSELCQALGYVLSSQQVVVSVPPFRVEKQVQSWQVTYPQSHSSQVEKWGSSSVSLTAELSL